MKIGIIGAGNIGGALATLLAKAGHQIDIANSRGPATLSELATKTGARAATVEAAVLDKDVVVVTIPLNAIPSLPRDLFAKVPAKTIVIDTNNYYPRERDGAVADIENGMTESAWVAKQLGRDVVKAFNMIYATSLAELGKPAGQPGRIAIAVAGNDQASKAVVIGLIDEIGFDAVDAGSLDDSWRQQPGSPVYVKDHDAAGVRQALTEASPQRTDQWKATPRSPGTFDAPA
ncbi:MULTISPECIES: NADPH-dependent F420 reductase [Rhizobium]|uniref:NAD(P)-binding domain-containing protein n=1 Tax=Rhizobium rhododendri TaxID=2506430 RepID=A0ABY8IES4_9HYPH|nr:MULTISPECIES: NAD(P)-binding domain-containing protein [Rhizobium]MBZ5805187.1 NAD(P)-binding domain-containing protein [Rhizobium sp. VS19-DR181]MBZ5833130.1 NAD(P)-binding domain-containing protein [Rhizobium sp. VS19-DR104.2]QXZ78638.1 NAD(P)-binding domain-containing protein [Rhizobium sp. L51/94]TQX85001.1 NADP oxidoreductase [Rhizobium sp. rho-13.1]TQY09144.1 NADP oxidoreductase [Rhizobium sp. rho-1.1]